MVNQDDDETGDDPELPDEADMDQDDDESGDSAPCPHCGKPVHDQAEICTYCRSYISWEDAPRRKPLWLVFGVILCVLIVLLVWRL